VNAFKARVKLPRACEASHPLRTMMIHRSRALFVHAHEATQVDTYCIIDELTAGVNPAESSSPRKNSRARPLQAAH